MADAAQTNPIATPPTLRRPRRTPRSPSVSYRPRPRSPTVPAPRAPASRVAVGARGFGPVTIGDQLFRAWAFEFLDRELTRALLGPAKPDSGGQRRRVRSRRVQPRIEPVPRPAANPLTGQVAQPATRERARAVVAPEPAAAPAPRPAQKPVSAPKSAPAAAKNPAKSPSPGKVVGGRAPLPRFQIPDFFRRISVPPLSPATVRLTSIKPRPVEFGSLTLPAQAPAAKPGLQLEAERCRCPDTGRKAGVYFVKRPPSGPESSIFWREFNASNASRSVGRRGRVKLKSIQR